MDKFSILQISGGLGKHVLATAFCQVLKRSFPDRKLIVVAAWPEILSNLTFVDRAYRIGSTSYFYDDYVKGKDSKFFLQEPYLMETHIRKELPLVESWCNMYGLEYQGEQPQIRINPQHRKTIEGIYSSPKPILVIQTSGGLFTSPRPYSWARDIPPQVAQRVVNHYRSTHQILQVTRPKGYELEGVTIQKNQISATELFGLMERTDKRLLIDSSMQHGAAALGLKSTVLWQATSPVLFGHQMHDNILAKPKENERLPGSVFFDYQFDMNDEEFPYGEEDLDDLYDIDQIIASLG